MATAAAYLCTTAVEAYAQNCKPRRPRPPITLTTLGPCEFNPETFSFAGTPAEQIRCLLRSADRTRNLGPQLDRVPAALASRAGQPDGLPDRDALVAHLIALGLVWDYAPFLWQPLSRARDNDPDAPQARYLVIHDTSSPFIGGRPFPADIDENRNINSLARYMCKDDWAFAHVVINRGGKMLLSRELSEPWRAMKFERATRFGTDLKGLFLHVELVQPRGSMPGRGHRNDARAPDPGFSAAQYERLALIYVIASVRSGRWLIPAFHAAIDAGIRGGHDDPQNFALDAFAASVDRLVHRLLHGEPAVAARPAATASPTAAGPATAPGTPAASAPVSPGTPVAAVVPTATETPAAERPRTQRANPVRRRSVRTVRVSNWRHARSYRYSRAYRYVRPKPGRRAVRVSRR